ncbi:c-type cytochrome [Aestuariivita boseongensis]|uniref:c-type cytochrome n=1 Tax=Aestuariivita boseongensis TaxID=1470562 RepID=UPI0006822844|nr:cytochrome c [Aestuariivita boseongensis]
MKLTYPALWLTAFALGACAMQNEMPQPREGAKLFADNCTACHGFRADEEAVLIGGQTAPNLSRISARNGGEFPRAAVLSQIDGFSRGSHAGEVMPEFGAELTGPLVPVDIDGTLTPTPRPLAALLAYLEDIQE